MEEDAGKSIHDADSDYTSVDFNRAGIPLVEIVTEPDLRSADEAAAYLTQLRNLVRHLKVCDGNMEQGSFRCDVNISVRKQGDQKLGTKVEIKNLNSIRFMKKAVEYETEAMITKLEAGEKILQQTKGFDEKSGTTYTIRIKEDEDDYRYFPEPDLPPFSIDEAWLTRIKKEMPPLQEELKKQLTDQYNLSDYDAGMIAADAAFTGYFLETTKGTKNFKSAANWLIGPIKNYCDTNAIETDAFTVPPASIASLINLVDAGKINYGTATQQVLPALIETPAMDIEDYIQKNNLQLQSGDETDKLIEAALTKHAEKITEYKKGKKGLISLFVGEVMKLSKGKADAKMVTDKILEKLKG
jgi:aspartyl-tRNA(Asn)/glutamyl-tRNA(Gln) amidotransferase subunit B